MARMRFPNGLIPVARWFRDRGLLYYRRARIVRCDTLDAATTQPGIGLEVQEASEEDFRSLAPMQASDASEWRRRRTQGCVCLFARSDTAYQGYLWLTRSAQVMTEVNCVLDASRDSSGAYLYDGFVRPDYRRKGVLGALLGASKRWAREQGLSRLYASYARDNHISERALRRAGFVSIVGDVVLVRVFDWEWRRMHWPRGIPAVDVLEVEGRSPVPSRVT